MFGEFIMHYQKSRRLIINHRTVPVAKTHPSLLTSKNRTKYIFVMTVFFALMAIDAVYAYRCIFPASCEPTITSAANDPNEAVFRSEIEPAADSVSQMTGTYMQDMPIRDPQTGSAAE